MTKNDKNRFLLVYSSQTGQAQAIAEEVADKATQHGLEASIHCISTTEKKFWLERESCLVFITSTTGDGEPPETAAKFWRRLKKKTLPSDHLKHLHFALLGLGDSNYTNFCRCGKQFDKRFEELGAQRFYPSQFADDATGLETTVEPWMEGLFPALKTHLGLTSGGENQKHSAACNIPDSHEEATSSSNVNSVLYGLTDTVDTAKDESNSQDPKVINPLENNSNKSQQVATPTETDQSLKSETPPSNQTTDTTSQNSHSELDAHQEEESLTHSLPPLSESSLNLPALPPPFLQMNFDTSIILNLTNASPQNSHPYPSAKSSVQNIPLVAAQVMTRSDAVKKALKISLDLSSTDWEYKPGDSFGVVCPNSPEEVDQLIQRLDVAGDADRPCKLSVLEGTKKRSAAVPPHLPPDGTIRYWFSTCCAIRSVPKKALVRALVEHTSDVREKRRLQELSSRQGAERFNKLVREAGVTTLDLLLTFPSCAPPVTLLLEHLARLEARPYSAASCQTTSQNHVDFVFNVVEIPAGAGRQSARSGVCTGWLDKLTKDIQVPYNSPGTGTGHIIEQMEKLELNPLNIQVPVFLRSNQYFRPPPDGSVPLILIGPGTGVAPFVGFLQQRENCHEKAALGECWLFFGCRNHDRDFLFRAELEKFVQSGVLSELKLCFSRDSPDGSTVDSPGVRYVQDNICLHGSRLCDLVMDQHAQVFVCGDARNMAKDVRKAFVNILQKYREMTEKEAESHIVDMVINKTYHEDVWA